MSEYMEKIPRRKKELKNTTEDPNKRKTGFLKEIAKVNSTQVSIYE